MSIGSLGGIVASASGAQLAQSTGSDVERAKHTATDNERHTAVEKQAASAAGIAATDGNDHQPNDRDADGRRLWEFCRPEQARATDSPPVEAEPVQSKDASGECGTTLDLTG